MNCGTMTTSSSMIDLCTVKQNFSDLMDVINPWTLSHFVMWLDIKVAEYKVYGHMVLDNSSVTTPQWLKSKDANEESSPSNHGNKNYSKPQHTQSRPSIATSQSSQRPQPPRQNRNVPSSSHYTPMQCDTQQYSMVPQSSKHQSKVTYNQSQRRSYASPPSTVGRDPSPQTSGGSRLTLEQQWQSDWSYNQQNVSPGAMRRGSDFTHKNIDSYGSYSLPEPQSSPVEASYSNHVNSTTNQERKSSLHSSSYDHHQQVNQSRSTEKRIETPVVVKIEISDDSNEEISSSHEPPVQALPNFTQTFASASNLSLSGSRTNFSPQPFPNLESSVTKEVVTYDVPVETSTPVPVNLFTTADYGVQEDTAFKESAQSTTTDSAEGLDQSWRDKKREYIQSVRKTNPVNPKAHSRIVQRNRPFPDPFPVESLKYGQKAQEMIESGIITRPAKMQFLDTVFNEIVKYTGLYPTPTQKMEVAKSIVQTFPKLNVRSKDSHISAADSWFVVLNDKFRNERRGLSANPRDIRHSHMIRQRAVQTLRRAHAMSIIYGSKLNTESDMSNSEEIKPSASQNQT